MLAVELKLANFIHAFVSDVQCVATFKPTSGNQERAYDLISEVGGGVRFLSSNHFPSFGCLFAQSHSHTCYDDKQI